MGRNKKKITNPDESMHQLMERAVSLFEEPYYDMDQVIAAALNKAKELLA